jgi:spore germination protein YaaH
MTSRFLNDVNSREKFILNLIKECDKYNFKGVNIDFENIYMKDKNKFTQFISELSYEFSKRNIILSVDVTVMGGSENWSLCYDRLRISELVDYLVVMTYDEHWASSPISGSVASYKWVEKSLVDIIKIVNSEKVIMGIPLYTRIWYEEPSKKIVNKMDVTSKSITMQGQNNLLKETGLIPLWDDEAKQFYISYILDSKLKKVWLEEEVSIKEKAKLVNKLNLAGVAMWSRGFETENIWEVISNEVGD